MATISVPTASGGQNQLQPGFRFCPTEEDLVLEYLRRRAVNEPVPSTIISDVDILSKNPWDLVPEGVTEKYYFSQRVLRWPQGNRCKRATEEGFWKATGKETSVMYNCNRSGVRLLVGLRKTMVYYRGKAPAGERTNWVMQEFRLAGAGLTPYRVMRPERNSDLAQHGHIAEIMTKENNTPSQALHDVAASAPMVPVLVNPDDSWVICFIYKKKERMLRRRVVGERKIPFYDFFAQANRDGTASTSS
ncbi:hypothetical protein ACP4OV_008938 [Aristida adscensionis]